jgi:hypothetical protein
VHPEVLFLCGYAVALVAAAAGIDVLGRRSTDPWSSPVLAASRPPDTLLSEDGPGGWPHSEVPTFHVGVSAVALAAGLVLTVAGAVSPRTDPAPTPND